MDTPDVLNEAHEIIRGPRRHFYGDPRSNFANIAAMWNAYVANKKEDWDGKFDAYDVAMMMVLLKCARGGRGYHRDSIVDIAGYAALAEIVCDDASYEEFRKPAE